MSKEQAIAFFEEISKNNKLADKVEKVVGEKNSDEAKAKELISLAQRYNFNFTQEEAASAQEALKKPLSPEEMIEVSGGKLNLKSSIMAMALLAGLGVGGAIMPRMEASAMKRTNYSSSARSSGKSGKRDSTSSLQPQTPNGSQQGSPATTGTQQQTLPQLAGATTPEQGETSPGEQEAQTRGTQQEKKVRKNEEHNKTVAKRYSKNLHCAPAMIERVRSRASSGALPAATWPAFPRVNMAAEKGICRFCGGSLCPTSEGGTVVNCDTAGCVYNWVFHHTGATRDAHQRGQKDYGHYARWALLPALILDSRLPTIGRGSRQRPRPAAIITPAEAWAVWQLIVGHRCSWVNVIEALSEHDVDETTIGIVILLLEESYDNLVLGNESFIDLGSEVQQLVAGYNDSWQQVRTTMEQRGYDAEGAIKLLEKSYNMLTDEQRQLGAQQWQQWQQWQQAEEARRQAIGEAGRQVIEMLQRGEKLSVEQAKKIAPMLKCGNCGKTGASAQQIGGRVYFQCPKCRKGISNKPANLLAMLQEGQAGAQPVVETRHQPQMLQRIQSTPQEQHKEQPVTAEDLQLYQDQDQPQQQSQMIMQERLHQNWNETDFGDDDDYDYYGRDCYDREGNPRQLREEKPHEVKERREDYENPEPGMMGDQDPSTPMMNQNEFNFNFGGQDMNQLNFMPESRLHERSTSDLNQRMDEIIDVNAFDNDSTTVTEENIQMMDDAPSTENQTRPSAERSFEMEIESNEGSDTEDEYPDEVNEQNKNSENQETNQNTPHLQSHRSMMLENTNETITPFATENLDAIGDELKNEISNTAPDFARIQSMLQSATKVGANISQLLSFDEVLNQVRAYAKDFGRYDIISLIDSWRYSQGQ